MVELRVAPKIGYQVVMVLSNLRVQNWEDHLVQNLELM